MILAPLLTEHDPAAGSEGAISPLGLYAISDSLGRRLAPGVRQRQRSIRFLTAMSVSLAVCRRFAEEHVAKDGVSEPWQVFEWYLVEGLVRRHADTDMLSVIANRSKLDVKRWLRAFRGESVSQKPVL